MTTQQIKKELARLSGLNTSQLRIKTTGNYSTAYHIKLKNMSYDKNKLERIARDLLEDFDIDARSGEILAGGNTFVFVDYDQIAIDAANNQNEKLLRLYNEKEKTTPAGCLVEFIPNLFMKNNIDGTVYIFDDDKKITRNVSPCYIAYTLLNMGRWQEVSQKLLDA